MDHSLPFGINIGLSAFSYVLGKVLTQCTVFNLNYLDGIMIFSETWQHHLEHLGEVFKWLEAADVNIKNRKCEFFKTKVHCLGFLVGISGVQPLPKRVTSIEAFEPPKDINRLGQFLGLAGFYRKFIPFFADITACLNNCGTPHRRSVMWSTKPSKNLILISLLHIVCYTVIISPQQCSSLQACVRCRMYYSPV